jgi:chromosome segregation ATPase
LDAERALTQELRDHVLAANRRVNEADASRASAASGTDDLMRQISYEAARADNLETQLRDATDALTEARRRAAGLEAESAAHFSELVQNRAEISGLQAIMLEQRERINALNAELAEWEEQFQSQRYGYVIDGAPEGLSAYPEEEGYDEPAGGKPSPGQPCTRGGKPSPG